MAATVSVKQRTGTSGAPTDTTITSPRLSTSDSAAPGTSNPVVKPTSGSNYSFWQSWFLNADTTPAGTINNIKVYSDGAIGWTGITLKLGTFATYNQATGTAGTTGNDAASASVGYNAGAAITMTDAATYTSGSPLSITGSLSNPSTGKISDFIVVQATISTSAVAGPVSAETITISYDET